MGLAFSLVVLALPWISGTGGCSFFGLVCVHSGRFIPCFAMIITSGIGCVEKMILHRIEGDAAVGDTKYGTYQGKTIAEWSEETGIKSSTIYDRIKNQGWSWEDALTIPTNGKPKETHMCEGCRHWRPENGAGLHVCNFAVDTGRCRTAYRGVRIERCRRKRAAMAAAKQKEGGDTDGV